MKQINSLRFSFGGLFIAIKEEKINDIPQKSSVKKLAPASLR